ncbi:MAG: hypothetical protein M3461_00600 [Pseudomonadota bacterium]|nr:hypothetical protein [Pseudomonadota bacterium]
MKATIEIPDDLYRQVKARPALQGRTIREVTERRYRDWLSEDGSQTARVAGDWVAQWLQHSIPADPPGPTAREIVEEGRNRLGGRAC